MTRHAANCQVRIARQYSGENQSCDHYDMEWCLEFRSEKGIHRLHIVRLEVGKGASLPGTVEEVT